MVDSDERARKPLGRKVYGTIGHLPDSQLGPSERHGHPGHVRIATEKERDRHDLVIVMEKLDGANCGVAMVDDAIVPLTRSGNRADTSRFPQHRLFAEWVWMHDELFRRVLQPGELMVGEWLALAHGTIYELGERSPWPVFDLFRPQTERDREKGKEAVRYPLRELQDRLVGTELTVTPIVHQGGAISLTDAKRRLGRKGWYGARRRVEGLVYRVERAGEFDFMLKWVDPYHRIGGYLPDVSGEEAIWNWRME